MDAPDELVEAVAQAFMEAWWANSLHAPTDWDRMSAHARQAYLDGARAVLSMPALAEVIARDAKVREIAQRERLRRANNPARFAPPLDGGMADELLALHPEGDGE